MSEVKNRFTPKGATPGPWSSWVDAGDWGLPSTHFIYEDRRIPAHWDRQHVIATIDFVRPHPIGAEPVAVAKARRADANTRLIAKAPDLAQKLEEAVKLLQDAVWRMEGVYRSEWEEACDAFLKSLKPLEEVDG